MFNGNNDNNNNDQELDALFKILVVGDVAVGKTSFVKRYVNGIYSNNYKSTIGVDFAVKSLKWDDNTNITLHFWDLAGQERFGTQVKTYFRHAKGCICIYDITNLASKQHIGKWKGLVEDHAGLATPCILLINKIDLI